MAGLDPNQPQESEPILWRSFAVALATAVIDAFVAFGAHISDAQATRIIGVVNLAAIGVAAVLARRSAYSPETVARILRVRAVGERGLTEPEPGGEP